MKLITKNQENSDLKMKDKGKKPVVAKTTAEKNGNADSSFSQNTNGKVETPLPKTNLIEPKKK